MRRLVGPIRERLADMLREQLRRDGIDFVYFDGGQLLPVTGYWKSQDVYRWESVRLSLIHPLSGREFPMSIRGWSPMKDIVRSGGVQLTNSPLFGVFEAEPVHPPIRKKRTKNG